LPTAPLDNLTVVRRTPCHLGWLLVWSGRFGGGRLIAGRPPPTAYLWAVGREHRNGSRLGVSDREQVLFTYTLSAPSAQPWPTCQTAAKAVSRWDGFEAGALTHPALVTVGLECTPMWQVEVTAAP